MQTIERASLRVVRRRSTRDPAAGSTSPPAPLSGRACTATCAPARRPPPSPPPRPARARPRTAARRLGRRPPARTARGVPPRLLLGRTPARDHELELELRALRQTHGATPGFRLHAVLHRDTERAVPRAELGQIAAHHHALAELRLHVHGEAHGHQSGRDAFFGSRGASASARVRARVSPAASGRHAVVAQGNTDVARVTASGLSGKSLDVVVLRDVVFIEAQVVKLLEQSVFFTLGHVRGLVLLRQARLHLRRLVQHQVALDLHQALQDARRARGDGVVAHANRARLLVDEALARRREVGQVIRLARVAEAAVRLVRARAHGLVVHVRRLLLAVRGRLVVLVLAVLVRRLVGVEHRAERGGTRALCSLRGERCLGRARARRGRPRAAGAPRGASARTHVSVAIGGSSRGAARGARSARVPRRRGARGQVSRTGKSESTMTAEKSYKCLIRHAVSPNVPPRVAAVGARG